MPTKYRPELPEPIPSIEGEKITVEENHRFEVFEGNINNLPQYEYTLNKSPIISVKEITGKYNGSTIEFTEGDDYQLTSLVSERNDTFTYKENKTSYTLSSVSDEDSATVTDESGNTYDENIDFEVVEENGVENVLDWTIGGSSPNVQEEFTVTYTVTFEKSVVDWDQGGKQPDSGTIFKVKYITSSIISRYLDASQEELESVERRLNSLIEAKFVDKATGSDLDRIGDLFGFLGRRDGRNDTQYRIYLKSIVQSFVSRGTKNGIKTAISAATDVPIEDITINEDFTENSYEVEIIATTPITGSLLEQVAEIADPSGVELSQTRFTIDPDKLGIKDSVSISEGLSVDFDEVTSDDSVSVNDGKTSAGTDNMSSSDSVSTEETFVIWDVGTWDEINWAVNR